LKIPPHANTTTLGIKTLTYWPFGDSQDSNYHKRQLENHVSDKTVLSKV
jgi:hypothetical protein